MVTHAEFTSSLDGEPYLEFLPVIDLRSGRLLGLEALVRWLHPVDGIIPPNRLIPQAEESGEIEALTRWILTEACHQACTWSTSIQLGVNCSIEQLRRGEVSTAVGDALDRTGLPSGQLTLEVTEDAISDPSASGDLQDLSKIGVQLSVDDVGTNWSSFEPFKRHAISTVKIDGSFVAGLESTQGINRLVVETVIHMAHSLGMSALVEQVENAAQVEMVRSFGADAAQGFFFALPMSSDDAAELARRDEVPHFSRSTERTLLRPVDDPAPSRPTGAAVAVAADHPSMAGRSDGDGGPGGSELPRAGDGGEQGRARDTAEDGLGPDPARAPASTNLDHTEDDEEGTPGPEVADDPVDSPGPVSRAGRKRLKGRASRPA